MRRLLPLALLALACARPDWFPLRAGARGRFHSRTVTADSAVVEEHDWTFACVGPRVAPGLGKLVAFTLRRDSGAPAAWCFQRRRDGVYLLLPGAAADPAPGWLKVLDLPPRPGRAWYADPAGDATLEVVGFEPVAVPAGRFARCCRVRVHAGEEGAGLDFWLAPGRGPVRWRRGLGAGRTEISELVSGGAGRPAPPPGGAVDLRKTPH